MGQVRPRYHIPLDHSFSTYREKRCIPPDEKSPQALFPDLLTTVTVYHYPDVMALLVYTLYFFSWLRWTVRWTWRAPALLRSLRGDHTPRVVHLRARLLAGPAGAQPPAPETIVQRVREADMLLTAHGVGLILDDVAAMPLVLAPADVTCGLRGMFRRSFVTLCKHAGFRSRALTVYVAHKPADLAGCSYPCASWLILDATADATVLVHEIGHLSDLWTHHRDVNNIMTNSPGGTHDALTPFQASMIRTSRWSRSLRAESAPRTKAPAA
jgi:hypothetical protein